MTTDKQTESLAQTYRPTAMLVVYSTGSEHYLESHAILKDGTPGAGKPVTKAFINAMLEGFSKTFCEIPFGVNPKNLLYADTRAGQEKYIWYTAPGKKSQTFDEKLNLEDGDYTMPGCIYLVRNGELYVFAYEGTRRPSMRTKLLKGPFFNYYADGKICLGSAKVSLPSPLTWEAFFSAWESLFWNSMNSHTMEGHNPVKGNICLILKEQKDAKSFDTSLLEPTINTVNDLVNGKYKFYR